MGYRRRFLVLFRAFAGFKWVWLSIIIFCGLSLFSHVLLWPNSADYLSLSAGSPWGIVTGIFVHNGFSHLFNNLGAFLLFAIFFAVMNLSRDMERNNYLSIIFFVSIFIAGIIVSGLFELAYREYIGQSVVIIGGSGLVYAAIGAVFASSINNLFRNFKLIWLASSEDSKIELGLEERARLIPMLILTLVTFILVLLIILDPGFLGRGAEIGVVAHGTGFLTGFAMILATTFYSNKFGIGFDLRESSE